MEAINISKKINGECHAETLDLYERTGILFDQYGDKNAALTYLYHAFKIHIKNAKDEESYNGPKPSFDLANLCHEIGTVHFLLEHFSSDHEEVIRLKQLINELS